MDGLQPADWVGELFKTANSFAACTSKTRKSCCTRLVFSSWVSWHWRGGVLFFVEWHHSPKSLQVLGQLLLFAVKLPKIISSPTTFASAWRVNVSRSNGLTGNKTYVHVYHIYFVDAKGDTVLLWILWKVGKCQTSGDGCLKERLAKAYTTVDVSGISHHFQIDVLLCLIYTYNYMFHPTKGSRPKNSALSAFRLPTSSGGSCPISRRMSREAKIDTLFFATFARCQDQTIQM